jgi:hypothetical protein
VLPHPGELNRQRCDISGAPERKNIFSMSPKSLSVAILIPWLSIGCTQKENVARPVSESAATAIDTSLPKEVQEKQEVIRRALFSLQEGYPAERLKGFLPGVKFVESQSQFLEGAKYLESWSFNGQPSGDEVPVSLFFTFEDSGSASPKKVDRVYSIKGSSGRFTVSRK